MTASDRRRPLSYQSITDRLARVVAQVSAAEAEHDRTAAEVDAARAIRAEMPEPDSA